MSVPQDTDESVAPDGQRYLLPTTIERDAQFEDVRERSADARLDGRSVVCVQGLGFVGMAVAAVLAAARDEAGDPRFFVVGVDRPSTESYWRVARLAEGKPIIEAPDPRLAEMIAEAIRVGNLAPLADDRAYGLADTILVDVQLDVLDIETPEAGSIQIDIESMRAAIEAIGDSMRENALVVLETTVPIGLSEQHILPWLCARRARRGLRAQPLFAHAFERVMPGPRYVDSIRSFPRCFSGADEESALAARAFLESFVDTEKYPLTELASLAASEFAKLLENSYRAANIALVYEWTLLAERVGVNLFEIVDSIRSRTGTHDNLRYPGFGVGGYCLTKDALLAQWSIDQYFGRGVALPVTLEALRINRSMPLHALELMHESLGDDLNGKVVTLCGITYVAGVADTRNTPAEILAAALADEGCIVRAHDPLVTSWDAPVQVAFYSDFAEATAGADVIVLAVRHGAYTETSHRDLIAGMATAHMVIDAQDVLDDNAARALRASGPQVLGYGKGHWRRQGLGGA